MTDNTQMICLGSEAKYFSRRGWTQHRVICPAAKSIRISAKLSVIGPVDEGASRGGERM